MMRNIHLNTEHGNIIQKTLVNYLLHHNKTLDELHINIKSLNDKAYRTRKAGLEFL